MAILRLHFQATGHKQPIVAVASSENLLATAEQGTIKIWSYGAADAEACGPTLLKAIACSRQPLRALFITPGGLHVVGVFAETGVVLFDVGSGIGERHVLLNNDEENASGGKIIAAVWNGVTCTLALATEAGGVAIYEVSPHDQVTDTMNTPATRNGTHGHTSSRAQPAKLVLRHEIIIKRISPEEPAPALVGRGVDSGKNLSVGGKGGRKVSLNQVTCLATDEPSSCDEKQSGAGILVGVAEGRHLCVWDLVTGSTLLTALAIAPDGCKVEKVAWYASAALTALLYSTDKGARRVDVHQLEILGQETTQLLSFTSDVVIVGLSFSSAPSPDTFATSAPSASIHGPGSSVRGLPACVYLHVIDRLRTVRTWLLYSGGATAISAYSLPPPAPRIPIPVDVIARARASVNASAVGPESPDDDNDGRNTDSGNEGGDTTDIPRSHDRIQSGRTEDKASRMARSTEGSGRIRSQGQTRRSQTPTREIAVDEEEQVDPRILATGALVAAILPGRLPKTNGPSFLVVAGVALTGLSFLPTSDVCGECQEDAVRSLLEIKEEGRLHFCPDIAGDVVPRAFGMRAAVSGPGGVQALAVLWAGRPSFQVLDVGGVGAAVVVRDTSLERLHRQNQIVSAPRSDRACFLTSWSHSIALETLLCGWNDGAIDVINPRNPNQRCQLLRPGGVCDPVTALSMIPASLLPWFGNQLLSGFGDGSNDYNGRRDKAGPTEVLAVVGNADGTLALWLTSSTSRPRYTILAHSDAVIAIRTAMDAPMDARGLKPAAVTRIGRSDYQHRGSSRPEAFNGTGRFPEESPPFFLVTAGANREVKVWGIDTSLGAGHDFVSLALGGYMVVGAGLANDRLSTIELLSDTCMACGFASGAVEVWPVPFEGRGSLATARAATQAFPNAHGAMVTSITISVGLTDLAIGGGDGSVGRAVFTTSADHTILRWVYLTPGEGLKPLRRYCLSSEPTAAALLPPATPKVSVNGQRNDHGYFDTRQCRKQQQPAIKTSGSGAGGSMAMFRVVAVMDGIIIVLEFAMVGDLLGERSRSDNTRQNSILAVANAFPGTPQVSQTADHFQSDSEQTETGGSGLRSAVGGVGRREAGSYDLYCGTRGLSKEWAAAGSRRVTATAVARGAWDAFAKKHQNEAWGRYGGSDRGDAWQGKVADGESMSPSKAASTKKSKRLVHIAKGTVSVPGDRQPKHGKKARVTTLTMHVGRGGACDKLNRPDGYRQVSGGKTIKLDPEFAVARRHCLRMSPVPAAGVEKSASNSAASEATEGLVLRPSSSHNGVLSASAQDKNMYSLELTMPTYNPGDVTPSTPSHAGPGSISDGLAAPQIHADPRATQRADSPVTPGDWLGANGGGSAVLGWPPSPPPPSHTDATGTEGDATFLELSKLQGSLRGSEAETSPFCIGQERVESMLEASAGLTEKWNRHCTEQAGLIFSSASAFSVPSRKANVRRKNKTENSKPPGAGSATVAKTAMARGKREGSDLKLRLPAPMIVNHSRAAKEETRPCFNFDSAQAPTPGMSGVGVAVPKGFSDGRLNASKRSFIYAVPFKKTARRKIGGGEVGVGKIETKPLDREAAAADVSDARRAESRAIEAFPTGLVMSKHFREVSTGREILMLEIEQTVVRRTTSPDDVSGRVGIARPRGEGAGMGVRESADADLAAKQAAAAAAAVAEMARLSPRSQRLRQVFIHLSGGRDLLTQDGLVKWNYVTGSIDRGLISQYQVKALFRQAHGGRQRGKMIWQDIIAFYDGMEAALDKACSPPLTEEFVIDSEDWNSLSASVYLTKRGDVYVAAVEAPNVPVEVDHCPPPPKPTPANVRNGHGDGIIAWATAVIANPDVPARLTLSGLSPERDYVLYAYAENGAGRAGNGASAEADEQKLGEEVDISSYFSVNPAPSGMSASLVEATRLEARTAREPDENLDVPWESLPEEEKMAEALAALSDPTVARAARGGGIDAPTLDDLKRCETDPVSKNKWRSFCRWWAEKGAGTVERTAFLLRECVFAAQQPEVVEEAARMGVQLLDGDWAVAVEGSDISNKSSYSSSARQKRWMAFRSWYRGGRVFDRAHEALIMAALSHPLPSPGSQGRPLTPRIAPTDRPRPAVPATEKRRSSNLIATEGDRESESELEAPISGGEDVANPAERENGRARSEVMLSLGEVSLLTPLPAEPPSSVAVGETRVHVTTLKELARLPPSSGDSGGNKLGRRNEARDFPSATSVDDAVMNAEPVNEIEAVLAEVFARGVVDVAGVDGIAGWEEERRDEEDQATEGGREGVQVPSLNLENGYEAAKRLRMEARMKFLAARTLTSKEAAAKVERLLDVKREDAKAKRAAAAASGVVARRRRAAAAARRRRRSQVERELALKRADELLERSGRAEDIRQRRGSLGTLRPEDVAAIGIFDNFNLGEFEPEELDPALFRRRSSGSGSQVDGELSNAARAAAAWAPRSSDERTLELQLACVHPRVCIFAAAAGVGVPDPEDALTSLARKKARWEVFSGWYFPPGEEACIAPQRQVLLDGEMSAATKDEMTRKEMLEEELYPEDCEEPDFVDWYCEEDAIPRRNFRQRRVEEMLQARRLLAMQMLGYVPMPFMFQELPTLFPPPRPHEVERIRLFPSRSPEEFSWADVLRWYGDEELNAEDEALRLGEIAGQRAALLDVGRAQESESQMLERRMMRWEDFRAALMRAAEEELMRDPFRVGVGKWQYSATLRYWGEVAHLGFDDGSGLENRDEVLDALDVARKEAQEERERVAKERRKRELARQQRLEEERRRREEAQRLRWMLETEERRKLVQQHMLNLKRQRALNAERQRMEREDTLVRAIMLEEKRARQEHEAKEAANAEARRVREAQATADAALAAEIRLKEAAETASMSIEDELSRRVEDTRREAERILREREAFLRKLYTPFAPLKVAEVWEQKSTRRANEVTVDGERDLSPQDENDKARSEKNTLCSGDRSQGVDGTENEEEGGENRRATWWWNGADAPLIWGGPTAPYPRVSKKQPGSRFVPHARAVLDGLDTQPVVMGRLSREFLSLLGLRHESVRDIYNKGSWTVKDGDAMVDGIQLGRIFTVFESDEVREKMIPVAPLERLGKRESSRGPTHPPDRRRHRPQTTGGSGECLYLRGWQQKSGNKSPLLCPINGKSEGRTKTSSSFRAKRQGAHTAGPVVGSHGSGRGAWPAQGWREGQVISAGAEAIAGLPLSGDERDHARTPMETPMDSQRLPTTDSSFDVRDLVDTAATSSGKFRGAGSCGAADTNGTTVPEEEQLLQQPMLPTALLQGQLQNRQDPESGLLCMLSTSDVSVEPKELSDRPSSAAARAREECRYTATKTVVAGTTTTADEEVVRRKDGHPHWGGFGPGYVPRDFRGMFGVAGHRKAIVGRKAGERRGDREEREDKRESKPAENAHLLCATKTTGIEDGDGSLKKARNLAGLPVVDMRDSLLSAFNVEAVGTDRVFRSLAPVET